jgi:RHS repeat-associated protein
MEGASSEAIHYGDLSDDPVLDTTPEGEALDSYLRGPAGLLEERSGGATAYPLADRHGDITTLADEAGAVESRQAFDPWGEQISGPAQEFGYLGAQQRPTDSVTGLIQMGARPYDPSLGAFLAEDPVLGNAGKAITLNHYPYAWDNVPNRYDLNGRSVLDDAGGFLEGAGGTVVEGAEDVAESVEQEVERNWGQNEEAASAVGGFATGIVERRLREGGEQIRVAGDAASDFWKQYRSPLESAYKFAGENWQRCLEGASPGAAIGFYVGTVVFPVVGSGVGAAGGGAIGCGGLVAAGVLGASTLGE